MVAPGKAAALSPERRIPDPTFTSAFVSGGKEQVGVERAATVEENMFMWRRFCGDQRLPRVIFESRLKTEFVPPNLTENISAARRHRRRPFQPLKAHLKQPLRVHLLVHLLPQHVLRMTNEGHVTVRHVHPWLLPKNEGKKKSQTAEIPPVGPMI